MFAFCATGFTPMHSHRVHSSTDPCKHFHSIPQSLRKPRCSATPPSSSSSPESSPATPIDSLNDESFQSLDSTVQTRPIESEALPDASMSSGDTASATARAIFDDVAANPEYYLNVSGVLVGMGLLVIVLSATVMALDSLPIVPDLLRMIGLVYLFWFLAKFLLSPSERSRLSSEVREFVDGVRGGEYQVIKGVSSSSSTSLSTTSISNPAPASDLDSGETFKDPGA